MKLPTLGLVVPLILSMSGALKMKQKVMDGLDGHEELHRAFLGHQNAEVLRGQSDVKNGSNAFRSSLKRLKQLDAESIERLKERMKNTDKLIGMGNAESDNNQESLDISLDKMTAGMNKMMQMEQSLESTRKETLSQLSAAKSSVQKASQGSFEINDSQQFNTESKDEACLVPWHGTYGQLVQAECDAVPLSTCRSRCACSACPESNTDTVSGCTDAIEACTPSFRNLRGVFIMENNSQYRMSDLIMNIGLKWRTDIMAIMCNSKFRNTFLRQVFQESSQLKDETSKNLVSQESSSLSNMRDGDFERIIKAHSDGPSGLACVSELHGPGGVNLARAEEKVTMLAKVVKQNLLSGRCDKALETDFVINLRLGDWHRKPEETIKKIEGILASDSNQTIRRLVFNAVLHYAGYGKFVSTEKSIEENVNIVESVKEHFQKKGFNTLLRSEPIADKDLCYMVTAKHFLSEGRGFGRLVDQVRQQVTESSNTRYLATYRFQ